MQSPSKNAVLGQILVDQFIHKGYQLTEIREKNATIVIFTHGKKNVNGKIKEVFRETYKDLIKAN